MGELFEERHADSVAARPQRANMVICTRPAAQRRNAMLNPILNTAVDGVGMAKNWDKLNDKQKVEVMMGERDNLEALLEE